MPFPWMHDVQNIRLVHLLKNTLEALPLYNEISLVGTVVACAPVHFPLVTGAQARTVADCNYDRILTYPHVITCCSVGRRIVLKIIPLNKLRQLILKMTTRCVALTSVIKFSLIRLRDVNNLVLRSGVFDSS